MPLSTAVENEGEKCELLIRPDDWEHESTRRLISTEIVGDSSFVINGAISSRWSETSKTSAVVVDRLALERAVNARCSLTLRLLPLRNHQQRYRPEPPYRLFSLHCSYPYSHRLLISAFTFVRFFLFSLAAVTRWIRLRAVQNMVADFRPRRLLF